VRFFDFSFSELLHNFNKAFGTSASFGDSPHQKFTPNLVRYSSAPIFRSIFGQQKPSIHPHSADGLEIPAEFS